MLDMVGWDWDMPGFDMLVIGWVMLDMPPGI